jgi:hypothetical protein
MAKDEDILTGVTIARDAFGDPRYVHLAELLNLRNQYEALGRMATLWSICTALGTNVPPLAKIVVCLGKGGPEALVDADLGELVEDGLIRVKGCEGRTEWRTENKKKGEAGGAARAKLADRRQGGRFVPRDQQDQHDQQPTSTPPATTSKSPAVTSKRPAPTSTPPASDQPAPAQDQGSESETGSPHTGGSSSSDGRSGSDAGPPEQSADSSSARAFDPLQWSPGLNDAGIHASLEAVRIGVVVDFELKKFRVRAAQHGWLADECEARWPDWLLKAHPTQPRVREALVRADKEQTARAALDRERLESEEKARRVEADRQLVLADLEQLKAGGLRFPARNGERGEGGTRRVLDTTPESPKEATG